MLGILIYFYFLFLGYIYSSYVFKGKDIYFRAWMGGIFGNVILMAGIVLPSFALGFTHISHIVLMVLALVPAALLIYKGGIGEFKRNTGIGSSGARNLPDKAKKPAPAAAAAEEPCMDWKVLVFVILPITLVIIALFYSHILMPNANGGVTTGQSTYGDLRLHLSFITSIAEQGKFPPDYSIFPGHIIGYPFFVDMLSSSLYLFGASLRWAVIVPSCVLSFLLVGGFYIVAYSLTKRRASAILATVFIFINGGFGFAYFMDGAKADRTVFTQIFTAFYHTPTNARANDFNHNICWANTICDMIIPQRTTMAGWCMFCPMLWLLVNAIRERARRYYIVLGILSGCMLMIHTHTLVAFVLICAVMFVAGLITEKDAQKRKAFFTNWLIFGGIAAIMLLPQFLFWTVRQAGGNSFMSFHFNWENKLDPYFWFYLKNWGIAALFAVPAVLYASKENKRLLLGCAAVFVAGELILFQPLEYDNNKIFFIVYIVLMIFIADWLLGMWDKLKGMRGRAYLAVIVIAAGTVSGALTICREFYSGITTNGDGRWQVYSKDDLAMAEYIKKNTPKDAKILTNNSFYHFVYSLTGRDIYLGPGNFVGTHGLATNEVSSDMTSKLKSAYSGSYEDLIRFCRENDIDYVYVGNDEKKNLSVNNDSIERLEKVYSIGTESLYKVN